jgi:hypothetical protein
MKFPKCFNLDENSGIDLDDLLTPSIMAYSFH